MIYKLMPFGEVERYFEIRKDGMVVLYGDPANGFPPNGGPSMKTVYLPDSGVMHAKLTWIKRHVVIPFEPSRSVLLRAARRQKKRTGFSYYLSGKSHPARKARPASGRN